MSTAIEFDFGTRTSRVIAPIEAAGSCRSGRSCWIDLDVTDRGSAEEALRKLGVSAAAIERTLGPEEPGRYDRYDDCLHLATTAVRMQDEDLIRSRLDILIGKQFVVTLHPGPIEMIDRIRQTCQHDFEKFAQTLGFIIYEIFDHLVDGFRRAIRTIESTVGQFQSRIYGDAGDLIFGHFGHLSRNLHSFRAVLLTTRGLLHKLADRKSAFISESTQPFLDSMADSVERLGADLAVAREILHDTLDLYMSMVSHRTNRVVTRLTIISVIFMPLTFLCGVYGMNFEHLPEVKWRYGYPAFWAVALTVVTSLIVFMKRRKWL